MQPRDIVQRFLASIGRPGDAAEYLTLFQAEKKEQFALIVVSEEAIAQSVTALVADLLFLRKLELTPLLCTTSISARNTLLAALPLEIAALSCEVNEVEALCQQNRLPMLVADNEEDRATLVKAIGLRKVVYLVAGAGLQPQGEPLRSLINLRTDYDKLAEPGRLPSNQRILLGEIRTLFSCSDHRFTVSITSAHDLLRELFTLKGAGTLLRRGTKVARYKRLEDVSQDRLSRLIESAFHRSLAADFYQRPVREIIVADEYRGAAILEDNTLAPYLSKFAVNLRAQGEGIGGDIWQALRSQTPRLFWRSRPNNPIVPWYINQCDGFVRGESWTVFWCGLETEEITKAVRLAHAAPLDFK